MSSCLDRTSLRKMLNDHFGSIPDPRVERTRAHQLIDIIAIALLATVSGADGSCALETYGLAKQDWLESFLDLPNGIPSHDTFARVFSRLDPVLLETQFQEWVKLLVSSLGANVIAIDGKSVRGSYDRENGVKALQLVSAWASEHQLVLGQCAVESKSNEITAIPILLAQLDLSGSVTFAEDKSRIRKDHAPRNMSLVRRLSLNLLRQEASKLSWKMKRYKATMDNQFLLKVLSDAAMILA